MTQSNTPQTPGVPAAMSVWPPSNPSGTVIPFPLPWGQTGCCPPGGMDALMKCYCDIQQASAFIGQIMIDQINNNPAVAQAIIAAIEKSGSNLPLIGITNGVPAQPGQVGEFVALEQVVSYPVTASYAQAVTLGVLQPGDWDCQLWAYSPAATMTSLNISLSPPPVGLYPGPLQAFTGVTSDDLFVVLSTSVQQVIPSTPQLIAASVLTNQLGAGSAAGTFNLYFTARRAR